MQTKEALSFFFSICVLIVSFFGLIALAGTSSTKQKRSGEKGHPLGKVWDNLSFTLEQFCPKEI